MSEIEKIKVEKILKEILKEYLKIRNVYPCVANSYLEGVAKIIPEIPFKELEHIRSFVIENKDRFPPDFVKEIDFEYIRRGGKLSYYIKF